MTTEEYKIICSKPNAIGRDTIYETLRAIQGEDASLIAELEGILEKPPIEKPSKHEGGPNTDFFLIDLKQETLEKIVETLFDREAGAVGIDGETTPAASRFAMLVDTWNAI